MALPSRPLLLCVRRRPAQAGAPARISLRMPSEVAAIEEAVEVITRHCLAGAHSPDPLRFRLQTALAEALANAVLRGNQGDCRKRVHVAADLSPDWIRVHVSDEGDGFDPKAAMHEVDPQAEGGRGLFLLNALVDRLHYNERGTALCMTLHRR